MKLPRTVAVFGSGRVEENFIEYQKAVQVGRMLAQAGYTICNGGYGGVMEAAARGAVEGGGKTIGITTAQFPGTVNRWIQEERKVPTWQDRLFELVKIADAYVVLDGGTGTLTELFIVWEMANQKIFKKSIILHGVFLRSLFELLKKEKQVIFSPSVKFARTPEEILQYLKAA